MNMSVKPAHNFYGKISFHFYFGKLVSGVRISEYSKIHKTFSESQQKNHTSLANTGTVVCHHTKGHFRAHHLGTFPHRAPTV